MFITGIGDGDATVELAVTEIAASGGGILDFIRSVRSCFQEVNGHVLDLGSI